MRLKEEIRSKLTDLQQKKQEAKQNGEHEYAIWADGACGAIVWILGDDCE